MFRGVCVGTKVACRAAVAPPASARWFQSSAVVAGRVPRPLPDPKESRQLPEVREDPMHQEWGGAIDIIEHEHFVDRQREAESDGFFFDGTIAEGESDCAEDPFSNGYLTEDEMHFHENYEPRDYIPDSVKQRIYFMYKEKGWSVPRLAQKFQLRSDHVSIIINMKDTEPAMIEQGMYGDEIDALMTQLYSGKQAWNDPEPSTDQGIHVAMLKDDQFPHDVVPIKPSSRDGRIIRVKTPTPAIPQPPPEERPFKAKYAIRDISEIPFKKRTAKIVDYDRSIRDCVDTEEMYRSWSLKYRVPRMGPTVDWEKETN